MKRTRAKDLRVFDNEQAKRFEAELSVEELGWIEYDQPLVAVSPGETKD